MSIDLPTLEQLALAELPQLIQLGLDVFRAIESKSVQSQATADAALDAINVAADAESRAKFHPSGT